MEALLAEITRGLGSVDSLEELLPFVLSKATAMFSADRAVFAVCNPGGEIRRAIRHNMPIDANGRLPVSGNLIQQVLSRRRTVFVPNTADLVDYESRDSVKSHNIRFMMGVPVMSASALMGVLYIDSTSMRYLSPAGETQRYLEALAGLVSLALKNVQANEEQKYRNSFTAYAFHNVRNALHVMRTNADELAKKDYLKSDGVELVDTISGSIDRLATVSKSVLALHKLETAMTSPLVEIDPVVELRLRSEALERFAQTVLSKGIEVTSVPTPMLQTDGARFGMIVDELLLNAIKYSPAGQSITVAVHPSPNTRPTPHPLAPDAPQMHRLPQMKISPQATFVSISVTNANRSGRIPPDKLRQLFAPFVGEEDDSAPVPSSGLGLSMVREVVTSLGGDIRAESDDDVTSFIFELPTRIEYEDD